MTEVMEYQCRIVSENRRKQYEAKQNAARVKAVKKAARITNQMISFDKIIPKVSKIRSDTDIKKKSTEYNLQCILTLSTDTLKDTFIHLGREISELTGLKKRIFVVDITRMWRSDYHGRGINNHCGVRGNS